LDIRIRWQTHYPAGYPTGEPDSRCVQEQDFRTRVRQDSAHFEQTGSDPDYGFIEISGSGSGILNFIFLDFDTIIKKFCKDLKGVM